VPVAGAIFLHELLQSIPVTTLMLSTGPARNVRSHVVVLKNHRPLDAGIAEAQDSLTDCSACQYKHVACRQRNPLL
jgi:hypothetical protein